MLWLSERTAGNGRAKEAERCAPARAVEAATRVLIADDNQDWVDGLALLLSEEGYRVRVAYDGLEAIEVARTFQPQVVVLDIRMPKLDGYDTARIFSRHPDSTRPVLIAITAWPGDAGRTRARMSGFDRYLTKPADPGEILKLLRAI